MSLRKLWSAWNSFWFGEGSPLPVALFRILIGAQVVLFSMLFSPEAGTFFGQHAIVGPRTTANWMNCPEFSILPYLPQDDLWLHRLMALLAVSGICLSLGIFSRLNAFISFLIILSLDSRNHFVLHTGDKIMGEMLLYLVFSRCGEALSFGRLARIWRPSKPEFGPAKDGSIFAQRLIQVQLAIVYWGAFTAKLHGKTWMDGTAVYYAVHLVQFQRFPIPFLLDHLWACQLATWGTLVLEFCLCFLIWVKEFRYPLLLAGALFHLGLDWVMVIPLFQYIMLSCYVCFIDAADLAHAMDLIRKLAGKFAGEPLLAAYDGASDLSARLAETVRRLDVLHLIRLEDVQKSPAENHMDEGTIGGQTGVFVSAGLDGPWHGGARALRALCLRLPLLLPLYFLFWLPGADMVVKNLRISLERIYGMRTES